MKISDIISNLKIPDIQDKFISIDGIEVWNKLNDDITIHLDKLHDHISAHFQGDEMLRTKQYRNLLLNKLSHKDARILCDNLGIKTSDMLEMYEKLSRKSFPYNSEAERTLFEFFEEEFVPYDDDNDAVSPDKEEITPTHKLFDHQISAVQEIQDYLEGDKHKCLLHMPTGSGKTKTAMHTITNFFLNSPGGFVIWLAYSEELCEQAIEEFKDTWTRMGSRTIKLFRFFGNHSQNLLEETKQNKEGFIVASLGKLNEADKRQNVYLSTLSDRINFVIMDEAHQAPAPTYRYVLEQLTEKNSEQRPKQIRLLGLSATPGRTSNKQEDDTASLAKMFGHNKVTLSIDNCDNPIDYLIKKKYISRPHTIPVEVDSDITDEDLKKINKDSPDIPSAILEKLGKNQKRTIKEILEIESLINSDHKRIIVFGVSKNNSRDVSMILNLLGHRSFHVDNDTTHMRRRQYINEFKSTSDDPIIMCNYGIFTTGFDAPQTTAVVIARPTKSSILYSQMVGRGMRGEAVGGNDKCEIRVITDIKLSHFKDLVHSFFEWDEVW